MLTDKVCKMMVEVSKCSCPFFFPASTVLATRPAVFSGHSRNVSVHQDRYGIQEEGEQVGQERRGDRPR